MSIINSRMRHGSEPYTLALLPLVLGSTSRTDVTRTQDNPLRLYRFLICYRVVSLNEGSDHPSDSPVSLYRTTTPLHPVLKELFHSLHSGLDSGLFTRNLPVSCTPQLLYLFLLIVCEDRFVVRFHFCLVTSNLSTFKETFRPLALPHSPPRQTRYSDPLISRLMFPDVRGPTPGVRYTEESRYMSDNGFQNLTPYSLKRILGTLRGTGPFVDERSTRCI